MFFRERLSAEHDLNTFACGNTAMDLWLRDSAIHADRTGTGRTYVWVSERNEVTAYFTLAPHLVRRADLPGSVGRGSPDFIPAMLLARLALGSSLRGKGLGSALLADALLVALEAMRTGGGRLIVVDAIDSAASDFYKHHGFNTVPGDPARLVIKASVAAKSLPIRWP